MEVGEVDGLPEPTEPPVADPAADGQYPPYDHDLGHLVNPFVIAPGRHREGDEAECHGGRKESLKEDWFLPAHADVSRQTPGSLFGRIFIRPQEVWLCPEGFWLSVGEDDAGRCQVTPIFVLILVGSSNPTASKMPHKGEKAAEVAAGEKKMHSSHRLSPFCVVCRPDGFLVSHCPQPCLCLIQVPLRLSQFFADSTTCA